MKIKKLLLASALLFSAYNVSAQTQVIAHRGFWKTEGSAQNSIAALLKADSIGCYGSEFDVWLAADDQLVVNHDPTFKGKRMENSPSTALTAIKLDNGESLPTLAKYLKAAQPLHTRLILELKAHTTPQRETKAIEKNRCTGQRYGTGKPDGIHHLLPACHERIHPPGSGRNPGLLSGR